MITPDDWRNLKPGESVEDKDGNICSLIKIDSDEPNKQFVHCIYKGTERRLIFCDDMIFNERWEPVFELNHPSAKVVSLL